MATPSTAAAPAAATTTAAADPAPLPASDLATLRFSASLGLRAPAQPHTLTHGHPAQTSSTTSPSSTRRPSSSNPASPLAPSVPSLSSAQSSAPTATTSHTSSAPHPSTPKVRSAPLPPRPSTTNARPLTQAPPLPHRRLSLSLSRPPTRRLGPQGRPHRRTRQPARTEHELELATST